MKRQGKRSIVLSRWIKLVAMVIATMLGMSQANVSDVSISLFSPTYIIM